MAKKMKRRKPTYKEIDLKGAYSSFGEIYYPVPGFDKYSQELGINNKYANYGIESSAY